MEWTIKTDIKKDSTMKCESTLVGGGGGVVVVVVVVGGGGGGGGGGVGLLVV